MSGDWQAARGASVRLAFAALAFAVAAAAAHVRADGGTVRYSGVDGPYRLTVFSTPTPARAGKVDVSVLVQDAATGDVAGDAAVTIRAWPEHARDRALQIAATRRAATNKLYRAALVPLSRPGRWHLQVRVRGHAGRARAEIALPVAEAHPRWLAQWPWLVWPLIPIAWFLARRFSSRARGGLRRRSRARSRRFASGPGPRP